MEKRTKYFNEYKKKNYKRINVIFDLRKDKDIIEHLEKCKSKTQYLRNLIRDDMLKNK